MTGMKRVVQPVAWNENAGKLPPIFVGRAGNDQVVGLPERLDGFIAAAISTNAPLEFLNNPGGAHRFDNQAADPGARPVVAAELAFMKEFLR